MKKGSRSMELTQLRYFQTVARLQHMTQAAREINIAQPSLSQAIAKLEDELGAPLFERRGRNIRLNAFGKAFLVWVERATNALDAGKREVADLAGLEHGVIKLGFHTMHAFTEPLRLFQRRYPNVAFRLVK